MDNHDNSQRVWTSSSLGRALNPAYPTNLAVILLTLVAGAVTAVITILNGGAFLDSFVSGGRIGLYLFLCWALTREIDPDHEESAFGSILFGLAGLAFVDQPALLVGFWMIGILRLVNRTTGQMATQLDTTVLLVASLWLAWSYDWALGAMAGLTFVLDSSHDHPVTRHRVLGGLLLLLSVIFYFMDVGHQIPVRDFPVETYWVAIAATLLIIPLILGSNQIVSRGDYANIRLDPARVRFAQLIMITTAIILLTRSKDGLSASLVEWASLFGAGTWYIGSTLFRAAHALRKS